MAKFSDFTSGITPTSSDVIVGYLSGGGSGSDRQWTWLQAQTYVLSNLTSLTVNVSTLKKPDSSSGITSGTSELVIDNNAAAQNSLVAINHNTGGFSAYVMRDETKRDKLALGAAGSTTGYAGSQAGNIATFLEISDFDGTNAAQVVLNGTISGTTLTVNSVTSGTIAVGQVVAGAGVAVSTLILSGSGTTWTVNKSQSVGPVTMTASLPPPTFSIVRTGMVNGAWRIAQPSLIIENAYYGWQGLNNGNVDGKWSWVKMGGGGTTMFMDPTNNYVYTESFSGTTPSGRAPLSGYTHEFALQASPGMFLFGAYGTSNRVRIGDPRPSPGSAIPVLSVLGSRSDGNGNFPGRLALGTYNFSNTGNIGSGTRLGAIFFGGQVGASASFSDSNNFHAASIEGVAGSTSTFADNTHMNTDLRFLTGSTGVADNSLSLAGSERMRIFASGGISVNNTTDPGAGNVSVTGYVKTQAVAVASLPSASTAGAGARLFVTDATVTTFASIVAGSGSNGVPVYSDGTNWRIG